MTIAFSKFRPFIADVYNGKHNFSTHQIKVALCAAANLPVNTNGVLADLTQISYTNLSGRDLTVVSSSQSAGTYKLIIADAAIIASGGAGAAFQAVVLYNDTAAGKPLIGWYDLGAPVTLNNGDALPLDFDGTNGVIQDT